MNNDFRVRWQEFGAGDRVVNKEKGFASEEKRAAFVDARRERENFWRVTAWSDSE